MDDATRRRVSRRRFRRGLAVTMAFGSIAMAIALYFSPVIRVERVEVTGAAALNPQEIEALADIEGQSMLTADLDAVQRRIQALPLVASVEVQRRWPQTVRVVITERAPWGVWMVGETPYVIDGEGVVLGGAQPPDPAPTIRSAGSTATLNPGDRADVDAVRLARALLEQVPQRLALNVASLDWTPQQGLTLSTDAGYRVVIGDSENMDYKLAVWQQIETDLGRESMNGHLLDLRFGDRPVFQ
jgi:cell division protein FtsQ